MGSVEPKPESVEALLAAAEEDGPIIMINLLRYRERAAYPEGFDAEPCSGREAYARYSAVAMQTLAGVGARPLWLGAVQATVIAPQGESWDDAILVEYPSRKAFVDMVTSEKYQSGAPHRTAALEDSRLIATTQVANLFGS
ncbi:MAG: DUF1330 domain-containing protein [Myxococcota bacterium]